MISRQDFSKKQILVYYPARGDKLACQNDNIVIRDRDNKIKHQSTCYRLFALFVVGNTTITTGLIQRSKKFGFSICFFSMGMKLYEVIGSRMEGNTLLRQRQYEYKGMELGQRIIENKIYNQRQAINSIRRKTLENKQAIRYLDRQIENLRQETMPLLSILGVEESAAKTYFAEIFDNTSWQGRKPRIKCDYVNTALDIGYTVLFYVIDAILNIYGFDTYYGVLHRCFYMRKSLVCDIMEPFRPVIDLEVRKAINLRQIKEEDFDVYDHRVVLKWKKSSEYTGLFMEAVLEHKEEIFEYYELLQEVYERSKGRRISVFLLDGRMIIVSYDIADDKLRRHFSKYLSRFGRRLQYSVFEIENSEHILSNISADIENRFKKKFSQADSVYVFQLSKTCKIQKYGYAVNDDADFILIK